MRTARCRFWLARDVNAQSNAIRYALLLTPIVFVVVFLLGPLITTLLWSVWERDGFSVRPGFTLEHYQDFFTSARLFVLERGFIVATAVTCISLIIAYPVAYFLAMRVRPELARRALLLFTVPFLVNHVIRNFALAYLLSRTGPVNQSLIGLGIVDSAVDWLLFSHFSVFTGLVASYMPFMIYPLWLALAGIDRRLVEASWLLGADPRVTFLRVTLPLSLPGVFAAAIFGFVGSFGESTVPIILGGVGYQLMGNTITSAMDVLNYPLAAAMSSVVVGLMLLFLLGWYAAFDVRSFLGKIVRWRY